MAKQLLFSQQVVSQIRERFSAPGGDALYIGRDSFAKEYDTLVSPTIDAPTHLAERVDPKSDVNTAIALYESYSSLNALEASSVGFWTYLTHVDLWDYMQRRFPLAEEQSALAREKKIREKWFLGEPSQGSLLRHPLAGLWWGVKLSVAPERGDGKYDLTRILYRDIDLLARTLGTYRLGRLPAAMKGILGYVFDHKNDFESEYEAKMRYIMKHFNSIGGVLQLSCLDADFYMEELERSREQWLVATKKKDGDGASPDTNESPANG